MSEFYLSEFLTDDSKLVQVGPVMFIKLDDGS